jgi:adenylylsulfate kinase
MIKILIIGLPGSGKTTLAKNILSFLNADWFNADAVRKKFKDWDFSKSGVLRQSKRMASLAKKSKRKYVIADFVCPYEKGRKIFKPNYLIWMNTTKKGRYSTFDKTFEVPKNCDLIIKKKITKKYLKKVIINILAET